MLEDLDSDFKAARNNNRKYGNRFDENGVFALCCGRHGVPITLFDIFGGEGIHSSYYVYNRKYALAAVENALKDTYNQEVKIGLMYDIICLSKKQIENTFPKIDERAIYAVSVFHAFAHIMSCQMKYHPKYINGFGHTDGEGCERLWSYLNGFIPISRSMTKDNRRFLLTDAVEHFNTKKMLEIPSQISKKIKKTLEIIEKLEKKITEEKYTCLAASWKQKITSMSEPISGRYLNSLSRDIEVSQRADLRKNYYCNVATMFAYDKAFYAQKKTKITSGKRKRIEDEVISFEQANPGTIRPSNENDPNLESIRSEANIEFANTLHSLFFDHTSMILLKEIILKKPGTNGEILPCNIYYHIADINVLYQC
ncbi:unnamed protein product [Mucor hiemalis]